ncbi:MAG: T9SS type A sorting domain-containing protein [Candidatus Eisenbacteria bacterium]
MRTDYLRSSALVVALLAAWPAGAAWRPDGMPLCGIDPYGFFRDPSVAPDGSGGAFASWFNGARQMNIQRLTSTGDYAPGWPANGVSPTSFDYFQNYRARLVPDNSGGVYVVWLATFCGASCHNEPGQVYIQRLTGAGAVAPGWPAAGIPVTEGGSWLAPVVAPDGAGGVLVAWMAWSYPARNLVHVQRMSPAGGRLWAATPNGAPVAPAAPGSQESPALAPDGSGGAFVAWTDRRPPGTNSRIFLQHLDAAGALADSAGILLSAGALNHRSPILEADGAGGAFVAWEDSTAGAGFDIRAQNVNALAQPQWGSGIAVTNLIGGNQTEPALLAAAAGSLFLAWTDAREGGLRIYATRLDGSGQAMSPWPAGGAATNTAPAGQRTPRLVTDAGDGCFLSWNSGITRAIHLRGDGSPAPGWTAQSVALCAGNCGVIFTSTYLVADGLGGAIAVWDEDRFFPNGAEAEQSFAARLVSDGPVAVSASLVSSEVSGGRVRIVWQLSEAASLELERAEGNAGAGWSRLSSVSTDSDGRVGFEDSDVRAGERYGYRLVQIEEGRSSTRAEEWVTVPHEIGLRIDWVGPNPATGAVSVSLTLSGVAPATIEVLDVGGRSISRRRLEGLGTGSHTIRLAETQGLASGIYTVQLSQAGRTVRTRVGVLR